MKLVDENIFDDFNIIINRYMVFLVHVQKSSLMQVLNKMEIFNVAQDIASEIKAIVEKTLDNINEYNITEKKIYIKDNLLRIEAKITTEINKKYKEIKISDDTDFLLNNIFETLKIDNNGIKLTAADISNMYFFTGLNSNKEKEEKINKELEKLKDESEKGLRELKLKTFLKILRRKNIRPERFYEVNEFILNKCVSEKIVLILGKSIDDNKEGLYFIVNKKNFEIRRKKQDGLIVYAITISDLDGQFNINIDGKIRVKETEETFNIDEIYPNAMMEAVLNTYNIKKLINIFNLLFEKYYSDDNDPDDNNDIDDYLSGKIKND
jgi:hypothetical protein